MSVQEEEEDLNDEKLVEQFQRLECIMEKKGLIRKSRSKSPEATQADRGKIPLITSESDETQYQKAIKRISSSSGENTTSNESLEHRSSSEQDMEVILDNETYDDGEIFFDLGR